MLLLRRPLLLALALGAGVSALASGRFSARLIADGAISFAFVPIVVLIAFAIVYRRRARPVPFTAAADRFFEINTPWLVWIAIVAAAGCTIPPRQLFAWTQPLVALGAVAAVWSIAADVRFFRVTLGAGPGALVDVALHRAISWTAIPVYFFAYALPPELLAVLARLRS